MTCQELCGPPSGARKRLPAATSGLLATSRSRHKPGSGTSPNLPHCRSGAQPMKTERSGRHGRRIPSGFGDGRRWPLGRRADALCPKLSDVKALRAFENRDLPCRQMSQLEQSSSSFLLTECFARGQESQRDSTSGSPGQSEAPPWVRCPPEPVP